MFKDWNNKKICFLGFGIENQALLEFLLKKKIKADFYVCDQKQDLKKRFGKISKHKNVFWNLGEDYDKDLGRYDVVSRVAGYPLFSSEIKKCRKKEIEITSPIKLFFQDCPTKNIVGITGTKGKGTTSALIYSIIKESGRRVFWGGNIGYPVFSFFDKIKTGDWVVLELSSFQLEDLDKSPRIGVITNFSKEHLSSADPFNPNYHKSLKNYFESKLNLILHQSKKDYAVVNQKLRAKIEKYPIKSNLIYFSKSDLSTSLPGEHNKENIAAAQSVARIIKIKRRIVEKAVKRFKGLEHRIEFVEEKNNIKYYDDSFATTPESSIIAMRSFSEPVVLLAGGADKGSSFASMAAEAARKAKVIVLFDGQASPKIQKELAKRGFSLDKILKAGSMAEAVEKAKKKSGPGDVVLLSPGCASFGLFKNYKQRGDLFKQEVRKI